MKKVVSSILLLIFAIQCLAQTDSIQTKFIINVPLIDLPVNSNNNGLAFKQFSPSMQQSLQWTKSIAEVQQYYTKRLFFNPNKKYKTGGLIWRSAATTLTNFGAEGLMLSFPLSSGWMHEEWHRAVMNNNNVRSFNDINKIPLGATIVAVSHVTDDELANFKATNNIDFVRMNVAGIEAQTEYIKELQKDNFYYKTNLYSQASYWFNTLNVLTYVNLSSSEAGDKETLKHLEEEGTNINIRDFTGLDMAAWVYDLSRPEERYSDRGLHPSGVGIRRYRLTTDLKTEELDYLKKMGSLQFLNLISPHMFFINSIKVNEAFRFNFGMFHYLTSFGYDAGSNFYLDYKKKQLFLSLHNYHNLDHSFYGLEAQVIDHPLVIKNAKLFITPGLHIWMQPKDQQFRTSSGKPGGKAEIKLSMAGKVWRPYITMSAKTAGWVAGDVFINSNISGRVGISAYVK